MSLSWYAARARLIRACTVRVSKGQEPVRRVLAFCPPLTLTPRSPISVSTPSGSVATSCSSAHACRILWKRSSSYGWPKRTLSRKERFWCTCEHKNDTRS